MGSNSAFDRLVATACCRKWLAMDLMEAAIPPTYRPRLFRARQWPTKTRNNHDLMIRSQPTKNYGKNPAGWRREDPSELAASWGAISGSIQIGQRICGPQAQHLTNLPLGFFERR